MAPRVSMVQERLIGHIVVIWARIEAMLQDIIWLLFGIDLAEGRLITARLDVRPKLEMIEALAPRRISDAALLATLLDAVDIIRLRQGDRNFIVHGSWGTIINHSAMGDEHAAMSLREKSEQPDQIVVETFPRGRMREIIRDLEEAQTILRRTLPALGSLLGKRSEPGREEASNLPASPAPHSQSKRPRQRKPSHP